MSKRVTGVGVTVYHNYESWMYKNDGDNMAQILRWHTDWLATEPEGADEMMIESAFGAGGFHCGHCWTWRPDDTQLGKRTIEQHIVAVMQPVLQALLKAGFREEVEYYVTLQGPNTGWGGSVGVTESDILHDDMTVDIDIKPKGAA